MRVDGVELTALGACALNRERRKIGMIFQQFNLFATRTVLDNVAYPLRFSGMSRRDIREKAESLLRYVELEDKRDAYPSPAFRRTKAAGGHCQGAGLRSQGAAVR